MAHESLHWGYNEVEPTNPYWGAWTSTINWCEQDYAITKYMAEFINTITNAWVLVLVVTLYGIYQHNLPKRYWVSFLGISCVGLGSWMFHMTLLWEWQVLGDELPMIIATTCVLFMLLETTPVTAPPSVQRRNIILSGSLCTGIVVFVSVIYIWTGIAVFHQVSFAVILLLCGGRAVYLLQKVVRKDDPDIRIQRKRKQARSLFIIGVLFFALGFLMWNLDNLLCRQLMVFKKKIGIPLAFFFELHGWWHLLTGYGTILMSHAAMMIALTIREGPQNFELKMWGGWFPVVKRVRPTEIGKGALLYEDEELDSFGH